MAKNKAATPKPGSCWGNYLESAKECKRCTIREECERETKKQKAKESEK